MNELYQLVDLTHGLLLDLKYGGLIEYQVEIEELEIKSSSPVQRRRLLDLMVSPTVIYNYWKRYGPRVKITWPILSHKTAVSNYILFVCVGINN